MSIRVFPPPRRLFVMGIVYLALMFLAHLPDRLILFPTRAPIHAGNAVRRMIPFEGGKLEVWTARSQRAKQQDHADVVILRFYGNAGRADRWVAAEADMWSNRAVEVWGMSYPGWWNLWLLAGPVALQVPRELDSIANAKACQVPAIFLLAEKDEMVAPRFQQLVVNAYAGEKRVITVHGAYHNDPVQGAALANLNDAIDWLLATSRSRQTR